MSQISIYPSNPANITGSVTVVQPTGSNLHVQVDASALPSGASTAALQTTGNASLSSIDNKLTSPLTTKITNGTINVDVKPLNVQVAGTDNGLITNSAIHGLTTAGGGSYVDVKVTPSGALSTALGDISGIVGQQTMANSIPVTIASDQSTLAISAASLPLPTGAATETTLSALNTKIPANLTVTSTRLLVDGSGVTQPVSIAATVTTSETTSSTGTISSVSGSATSVTILASNASRKNATFYNDSTATLYLALTSSAASTTAYTVQIPSNGYYELPIGKLYTGQITGIWSSATGAVRVTELT